MTYQVKKPVSKFAFQVHNLRRYSAGRSPFSPGVRHRRERDVEEVRVGREAAGGESAARSSGGERECDVREVCRDAASGGGGRRRARVAREPPPAGIDAVGRGQRRPLRGVALREVGHAVQAERSRPVARMRPVS
jgi:hypothetical protein